MWSELYNLHDQHDEIHIVQSATLQNNNCGLKQEPALYGSKEWWNLIGTDLLLLHTIEGTITDVYLSGHNDYPQFSIDDGIKETHWQIFGESSKYVHGKKIRLQYVEMEFKPNQKLYDFDKCECAIRVEIYNDNS